MLNFHRRTFCWTDEWFALTLDDILELELKTKGELDEVRINFDFILKDL